MPYCPECGIHYLNPNSTCASCGRDLSNIFNSPDLKSEIFEKINPPNELTPNLKPLLGESGTEYNGFRSQVESHLGKGLIKPQAVEVGVDGFHFKFDQPPQKPLKSEMMKDKVVEFRVTAPADPPEQFLEEKPEALPEMSLEEELKALVEPMEEMEPLEPEKPVEPIKVVETVSPEPEPEPVTDAAPEIQAASEPIVEEIENGLAGEAEAEPEENGVNFSEPLEIEPEYQVDEPAPELPEPELKGLAEPEALWEGNRSWYGFPTKTQYRITNESLVIIEPYSYRFTEFELAFISDVKLNQTWISKLLGIGDLSMKIIGLTEPGLTLKGIREPEKVKRLLEDLLENKA